MIGSILNARLGGMDLQVWRFWVQIRTAFTMWPGTNQLSCWTSIYHYKNNIFKSYFWLYDKTQVPGWWLVFSSGKGRDSSWQSNLEALEIFVLEAQENTLGMYFLKEMKLAGLRVSRYIYIYTGYKTKFCKCLIIELPEFF